MTVLRDALREFRKTIGQKLVLARETRGLSQRDLAARVGLSAWSHISHIESGASTATPILAKKIAQALGAPDIERELLRARQPISDDVMALLLRRPQLLARLERRERDDRNRDG